MMDGDVETRLGNDRPIRREKHQGFSFVEFELAEDVAAAVNNMNESELFGWTISVNLAKPMRVKEGSSRPVWSDEDWVEKFAGKRIKRKVVESSQSRKPGAQPIYCLLQEAFLNPPVSKVYMDIKIGNKPAGCIQTLVRSDVVPMTAENFCYLCTHLKDLASREAASTALSPSSRARAVISQTTAAPGASPSTRRNLMMKTLSSNTQDQVCAGMALSVPWHIWPSWRPQKGRTSTLFYRGRNGHSRLPQTPRHQKPGDPEKTQTAKRETGGKAKRLRATPSRRFLPAVRHRWIHF
ncbi:peptidyl-prolyl cis-trans isomerase E-like isoform X4 [Pongo abelii]|uniref:peptidyl-prolyl cis-trans isomerase E-like isoform X4 n=2 Tax=Pongo TaxID=9599 RepID=UPI0023E83EFA|nr:peptidyl-prolyl cis-trans isomerase E-like isoform X4 [Pongo abelii]